jgi:hypothetical protein
MVKSLHNAILNTTKEVILASSFLSIFINEKIIVNNQSWISVHYYVMVSWRHVFFFTLECLVHFSKIFNLIHYAREKNIYQH